MRKSKSPSAARATIKNPAAHIAMRWGSVPPFNNPHYEVADQNMPTEANPVRLHKLQAGHGGSGGGGIE